MTWVVLPLIAVSMTYLVMQLILSCDPCGNMIKVDLPIDLMSLCDSCGYMTYGVMSLMWSCDSCRHATLKVM